jgi:predicted ATPase
MHAAYACFAAYASIETSAVSPVRIVISGCSGAGKSTLLAEMARRGHACMDEPGRAIVREEVARGGTALPWIDMAAFARRCLDRAVAQFDAADGPGPVFFDRSIIDAVTALARLGPLAVEDAALARSRRYDRVILAPPWRELFAGDAERRHDFAEAVAEYDALCAAYPAWGYGVSDLPRLPVAQRVDFLEGALAAAGPP